MSQAELNRLEGEVEAARARLAAGIERLRAPETLSRFKDELVSDATHTKDEWVEKTKHAVSDGASRVLDDLKSRAAANPLATAAIGAGLLWHLLRHPPITTLLIGAGAVGLMRTDPHRPSTLAPIVSRTREIARSANEKIAQVTASAGEMTEQLVETGEFAHEKLQAAAAQTREAAADIASTVATRPGELAVRVRQAGGTLDQQRDSALLGVAAAALVAAMGIAYGRAGRG